MSFLFEIKQRLKQPWLLPPYFLYKLKKLFKADFKHSRSDFDQVAIDVVLVTIQKDYKAVVKSISSLSNVCHTINKIFIVSTDNPEIRNICSTYNCVFIDENSYLPVKKEDINLKVQGWDRSGWILQQLLKFGADSFVEMPNFLILESDTIFLNPVGFLQGGKFVFGNSEEWNPPYFDAFKRLFGFGIKCPLSFIVHMMIFNKQLLKECKDEMEKKHNMPWYKAYLAAVDRSELSSIADYENYAHWVYCKYPQKVIRKIFYNTGLGPSKLTDWQMLRAKYGDKYNSVSFHSYLKD